MDLFEYVKEKNLEKEFGSFTKFPDLLLMDDHIPTEVKEKYRRKGIEIQ